MYNRDNKYKKRSSRDSFSRHEMYSAVCDKCGKTCKVPFKPTSGKPIYCSECFEQLSGKSSYRSNRRDSGRKNYRDKKTYYAVCDECGKECEVPFKPTQGKPIFCDECFKNTPRDNNRGDKSRDDKNLQKQMDTINEKLDKIIQTLESSIKSSEKPKNKSSAKKSTSQEKKVKKTAKKKAKKTVRKKASKPRKNSVKKKTSKSKKK